MNIQIKIIYNSLLYIMKTRKNRKNKTRRWRTAIEAAQITLTKTGSLNKARKSLRAQALANARRIFGSVGQ
jgi:hypothetical protein